MAELTIAEKAAQSDVARNNEQAANIIHARPGCQPVLDIEAFLAAMPDRNFEPEEFEAFEAAIAENRAMRRAIAQE